MLTVSQHIPAASSQTYCTLRMHATQPAGSSRVRVKTCARPLGYGGSRSTKEAAWPDEACALSCSSETGEKQNSCPKASTSAVRLNSLRILFSSSNFRCQKDEPVCVPCPRRGQHRSLVRKQHASEHLKKEGGHTSYHTPYYSTVRAGMSSG